MNTNQQQVFFYHEETKHAQHRYARSLGFMDWANQPNPFREYKGTQEILLPLAFEHPTPPYHLLETQTLPSAPLLLQSLSQFLQFSMGIAAIKSNGIDDWALRCNASSGNLHPSELYLITPSIEGVCQEASIFHYAPKNHTLEALTSYQSKLFDTLPKDSFLVGLSSIAYREIWKYGERAFRYTHLDAGHAMQAVMVSAKALGWHVRVLNSLGDKELDRLFGFDDVRRFHPMEREYADILLLISPQPFATSLEASLFTNQKAEFNSIANTLATNHQNWPLIEKIHEATQGSFTQKAKSYQQQVIEKKPTREAKEVILKRRSAQMMQEHNSAIDFETFVTLLHSTHNAWQEFEANINLVLFVHNVVGIEPGLYLYLRNVAMKEELQHAMDDTFLFQKVNENLYLLKTGNTKEIAKALSCNQSIASDGAFSLGMLAPLSNAIAKHGGHRYKELYWECGAIGQQLYLEATSLGLSATGIGCFLDDSFHSILGVKNATFASLYHFTIGRAFVDSRLLSKEPYESRRV